jgi:hypothetical protein
MRFVDTRTALIGAAALIAIGFLSIHEYRPQFGLVWNVLNDEIYLNNACPNRPWGQIGDDGQLTVDMSPDPPWSECGASVPYRWVLISIIVGMAGTIVTAQRTSN